MGTVNKSTRPFLSDNGENWARMPYQVRLGKTFTTLHESLQFMADMYGNNAKNAPAEPGVRNSPAKMAEWAGIDAKANFLGKSYFKDTRVGANDAINCIWQFNRDDDIVHPTHFSQKTGAKTGYGMGRVYAETTEQDQQIMWLSFGTARFTSVLKFYAKSFEKDLIRLNQLGITKGNKEIVTLGHLFGAALGALAFALPTWPIRWLCNFIIKTRNLPVSRFYDFRPTMHLYYRYVDSILANWIVSTGLYGTSGSAGGAWGVWAANKDSLPIAMQETGVGIWNILKRKAMNLVSDNVGRNLSLGKLMSDDLTEHDFEDVVIEVMNKEINPDNDALGTTYDKDNTNIWGGDGVDWSKYLLSSALGATQFLGFRIEKSTDSSESFSNSTGPSQFAEQLNNQVRETTSKAIDMGLFGGETNTGSSALDLVGQAIQGLTSSITNLFNMDGLSSAMISGAFIDIPEQYKSSSWGTSHSVTFQLRAPAGDITSIYQSIIVPLACILAGSLPRAGGPNSYVQPFFCRVYCKGMFSIPLGIVESLSIKRGSSEFGWTYQNLPTAVDVSITFKDMSPIMYMMLEDSTLAEMGIAGSNNVFHEYILTLAGTGLFERVSRWSALRRSSQLAMHKIRNMYTNSMFWMNSIGDSTLLQTIGNITPWSKIPQN